MSKTLSTAQVIDFDANVHHVYQGKSKLKGTVRERTKVVGYQVTFPVLGKGTARKRTAPQVKLELMNAAHSRVTCDLVDYNASDMTDIWDQAEVNFDEKTELAGVIAGGLGRRRDQTIIDALIAAKTAGTITNSVAATGFGSTNNLNIERVVEAARLLNVSEADEDGRYLLIHASQLAAALLDSSINDADKATFRALQSGDVKSFMGFNWIFIGDRSEEGGLAVSSNIRQCWAWQKMAIGCAEGKVKETDVSWLGDYGSWITSGFMKIGACVIDGTGCVEILCDES